MNNCEHLTKLARSYGLQPAKVTSEGKGMGYHLKVWDTMEIAFYPSFDIARSLMKGDVKKYLERLRKA